MKPWLVRELGSPSTDQNIKEANAEIKEADTGWMDGLSTSTADKYGHRQISSALKQCRFDRVEDVSALFCNLL